MQERIYAQKPLMMWNLPVWNTMQVVMSSFTFIYEKMTGVYIPFDFCMNLFQEGNMENYTMERFMHKSQMIRNIPK